MDAKCNDLGVITHRGSWIELHGNGVQMGGLRTTEIWSGDGQEPVTAVALCANKCTRVVTGRRVDWDGRGEVCVNGPHAGRTQVSPGPSQTRRGKCLPSRV